MFVKNQTDWEVKLPRGQFMSGISVAALVTTVTYRMTSHGLARWEGKREALPTDPPAAADPALWYGASVTVAGTVFRAGRLPPTTSVDLRVGAESRRLTVTGDRKWARQSGKLIASPPAPWEAMPLCWSRAFGGSVEVPAGPTGPNHLPQPGGRFDYPLNPLGNGFCLDERHAEGRPLPNIEWPDALMKTPLEQPKPAGFAPCPELPSLRVPGDLSPEVMNNFDELLRVALRMRHVAHGRLIFDRLAPDVSLELAGMTVSPLRFEMRKCPVRVKVRKGATAVELPPSIRCAHVSADDRAVLITYGHSFSYETPPSWVEVTEAEPS